MIIIVVDEKYKHKIEEAMFDTWEDLEKLSWLELIVDEDDPYKTECDLLDLLWYDPTGHVIVLYGPKVQRFKEDSRVMNNNVIDEPNFWPKAQQIYESINGKIQP